MCSFCFLFLYFFSFATPDGVPTNPLCLLCLWSFSTFFYLLLLLLVPSSTPHPPTLGTLLHHHHSPFAREPLCHRLFIHTSPPFSFALSFYIYFLNNAFILSFFLSFFLHKLTQPDCIIPHSITTFQTTRDTTLAHFTHHEQRRTHADAQREGKICNSHAISIGLPVSISLSLSYPFFLSLPLPFCLSVSPSEYHFQFVQTTQHPTISSLFFYLNSRDLVCLLAQ